MDDFENFLTGQTPEGETVSDEGQQPEVVTEPAEGPPRDEQGRFAPKADEPAPQAAQTPPPAPEVDHSPPPGLIEVRRKWQATEQEKQALAQENQQLRALLQQNQPPQQEPYFPSVYEDEAGFAAAVQQQAAQLARQQLMPEMQQQLQVVQHEMTRQMMASAHPDFLETEAAFWQMAEANPAIKLEMSRQANPVRWAYDYAKKAGEIAKIGSLDIAAIKAAAIAEFQAQQQAQPAPQQQQIPTSLADQQSARISGGSAPVGPPTLNQILGR